MLLAQLDTILDSELSRELPFVVALIVVLILVGWFIKSERASATKESLAREERAAREGKERMDAVHNLAASCHASHQQVVERVTGVVENNSTQIGENTAVMRQVVDQMRSKT